MTHLCENVYLVIQDFEARIIQTIIRAIQTVITNSMVHGVSRKQLFIPVVYPREFEASFGGRMPFLTPAVLEILPLYHSGAKHANSIIIIVYNYIIIIIIIIIHKFLHASVQ